MWRESYASRTFKCHLDASLYALFVFPWLLYNFCAGIDEDVFGLVHVVGFHNMPAFDPMRADVESRIAELEQVSLPADSATALPGRSPETIHI